MDKYIKELEGIIGLIESQKTITDNYVERIKVRVLENYNSLKELELDLNNKYYNIIRSFRNIYEAIYLFGNNTYNNNPYEKYIYISQVEMAMKSMHYILEMALEQLSIVYDGDLTSEEYHEYVLYVYFKNEILNYLISTFSKYSYFEYNLDFNMLSTIRSIKEKVNVWIALNDVSCNWNFEMIMNIEYLDKNKDKKKEVEKAKESNVEHNYNGKMVDRNEFLKLVEKDILCNEKFIKLNLEEEKVKFMKSLKIEKQTIEAIIKIIDKQHYRDELPGFLDKNISGLGKDEFNNLKKILNIRKISNIYEYLFFKYRLIHENSFKNNTIKDFDDYITHKSKMALKFDNSVHINKHIHVFISHIYIDPIYNLFINNRIIFSFLEQFYNKRNEYYKFLKIKTM